MMVMTDQGEDTLASWYGGLSIAATLVTISVFILPHLVRCYPQVYLFKDFPNSKQEPQTLHSLLRIFWRFLPQNCKVHLDLVETHERE
jgi:hypothetical protein